MLRSTTQNGSGHSPLARLLALLLLVGLVGSSATVLIPGFLWVLSLL